MAPSKVDPRREWALKRISKLQEEIIRLEVFLSMLDQSEREIPPSTPTDGSVNDTLAGQIREVLREASPKGLRPAQVARRLLAKGVSPPGETPFSIRVGNDLYRMAKRRAGVVRIQNGLYALLEGR